MADPFLAEAARVYAAANTETLRWMLERPALHGSFVNTKVNSITLADYGAADGWRGPDFTYGWIQGRALEALAIHATAYPAVRDACDAFAARLYRQLDEMTSESGHAYFCYDSDLRPIIPDADGRPVAQQTPRHIHTYSDAFVAKGLVAAAARYGGDVDRQRAYLNRVIAAIPAGRFQMDEKAPLGTAALAAQPPDFGPRMILLGAAAMVSTLAGTCMVDFAEEFIAHVLAYHLDPVTGLLRTVPGGDSCNVGHAIEFVGFVMDYLGENAAPELIEELERILIASFHAGFTGPGIRLTVAAVSLEPTSPYCPWWSLPETIRAAALVHERTGTAASLAVWKAAHAAFFGRYWRAGTGLAYQTMTADGPVDYVPATPDLDPGYHTGLSLLAAQRAAERLS